MAGRSRFCRCNFGVKGLWNHEKFERSDDDDGTDIFLSNLTKLLYATGEELGPFRSGFAPRMWHHSFVKNGGHCNELGWHEINAPMVHPQQGNSADPAVLRLICVAGSVGT